MRIARVGTEASFRFLVKEYSGAEPNIASRCAVALLSIGDDKAVRAVIKGYDRGGRWGIAAKVKVLDALAASSSDDAWTFVLRQAKSGSRVELRVIAIGSLTKRPKDEQALEILLKSIGHSAPEMRRAALRSLTKFRAKAMIPALIERIGRETEQPLRRDSLELLVRLTGLDMGFVVEDWKKWWNEMGDTFKLRGKGEEGARTRVADPDMTYFGLEVSSKRVAFLVDASMSMKGSAHGKGKGKGGATKIAVLKQELTSILKKLPETTAVNIIYFHRGAFAWKKQLHSLRGTGRQQAIDFVQGLTLALQTQVYEALELALADRRVDTIYLLSDGRPVGGKIPQTDRLLEEIGAQNRIRGAKIHCISFGQETAFLKKLAEQNNGVYRSTRQGGAAGKGKGKKGGGKQGGGKKGGKKGGGKKGGGNNP